MNKKLLLLTVMLLSVANVFAQDIIRLKHGGDIKAIVQEIGKKDVRYKKFDHNPDTDYWIKKSEIFGIRYATDSIVCFAEGIEAVINGTWRGMLYSKSKEGCPEYYISIKYDWTQHKFSIKYDSTLLHNSNYCPLTLDCDEGELFLVDYDKKKVVFYENLPNGCIHDGRIVIRKFADTAFKVTKSGPNFSKAWFTGLLISKRNSAHFQGANTK